MLAIKNASWQKIQKILLTKPVSSFKLPKNNITWERKMKVVKRFEPSELPSIDLQKYAKQKKCGWNKTVYALDKDKKVVALALNIFDQIVLFFQKLFCCRSTSELKLKSFTRISTSDLQALIQKHLPSQPIHTPVKSAMTQAIEKIDQEEQSRTLKVQEALEALDPMQDEVQELYAVMTKDYLARVFGQNIEMAGRMFNKVFDMNLQDEVIDTLLAKKDLKQTVIKFANEVKDIPVVQRIYARLIETYARQNGDLPALALLKDLVNEGKDLGNKASYLRKHINGESPDLKKAITFLNFVDSQIEHEVEPYLDKIYEEKELNPTLEEPTLELAQRSMEERKPLRTLRILDKLDSDSLPVQELYVELAYKFITEQKGAYAGFLFNKIKNLKLKSLVINKLALESPHRTVLSDFVNQVKDVFWVVKTYNTFSLKSNWAPEKLSDIPVTIFRAGRDLGEPLTRVKECMRKGNFSVADAMKALMSPYYK